MEQSLSLLTFKGSITDAIIESKNQRKLFVVYISGDDAESSSLEKSTWTSSKVAESLSKYCILLHIPSKSNDAPQFAAIYPQKSVPCITAIGYNGIQLWQIEGFVSAEVLASNLETAWLGLHIQETTASVLTAALALKNSEESTSIPSASTFSGVGSSSPAIVSQADHHFSSSESNPVVSNEVTEEEKRPGELVKNDTEAIDEESKIQHAVCVRNDESPASSEEDKSFLVSPVDLQSSGIEHASNTLNGSSASSRPIVSHQAGAPQPISVETTEYAQQEKNETVNDNMTFQSDSSCSTKDYTPDEVHLNIRLLNGATLQEKFFLANTLRVVKDYVNSNQESASGSYDLAIPYPRKVFTDHDLDKALSDLGLSNRQALLMVRRQGASSEFRGTSSSFERSNSASYDHSSNENDDGYLAYIKRFLSYVNPFSYLGGRVSSETSSSTHEFHGGTRQYSARNDPSGPERLHSRESSNQSTPTSNTRSRKPSTSRFGANIHTLKHDEEDEKFRGRNSFWNGNSTQYGGDNDSK